MKEEAAIKRRSDQPRDPRTAGEERAGCRTDSAQRRRAQDHGEQGSELTTRAGTLEWCPQGEAEQVRVYDFPIPGLGRATPYEVYDVAQNAGCNSTIFNTRSNNMG